MSEVYEFMDAEYATSGRSGNHAHVQMAGSFKVRVLRMAVAAGISDGEKKRGTQASGQEGF